MHFVEISDENLRVIDIKRAIEFLSHRCLRLYRNGCTGIQHVVVQTGAQYTIQNTHSIWFDSGSMLFRTVCIQNKPYPIHIQLVNLGVRIFYCLSLFHRIRLVYALFCLDAVFSNAFSGSYREINAFFEKIVLPLL